MAVFVVTAARVEINSVDMSSFGVSAELSINSTSIDTTSFGSGGWEAFIAGMKSGSVKIMFNQDFATTTVDDRLWALFNAGANVAFKLRPTQGAIAAGNPEYTGSLVPVNYSPLSANVGDKATTEISWPTSGAITRAVS